MADDTPRDPFLANPFAASEHDADPPADVDDEPRPASMSMTKAELLERLRSQEEGMTKAQLLELIQDLEGGYADPERDVEAVRGPFDPATRSATINGQHYTWTEESEHTVPEEARLVYARSKATRG